MAYTNIAQSARMIFYVDAVAHTRVVCFMFDNMYRRRVALYYQYRGVRDTYLARCALNIMCSRREETCCNGLDLRVEYNVIVGDVHSEEDTRQRLTVKFAVCSNQLVRKSVSLASTNQRGE